MSTLYRKYRPQNFASVIDQEHVVKTITNEIATGKIAHAYLFSGPRGVGKTTLARLLAKSINCVNKKEGEFEPCNTCSSCAEITAGNNIDVIEIDAASHTGVDNVRENIIENAQFKPTRSKYKVFIIDEVHMLSASAFNALLKTLEEPPSHVVFVLATTELHKLPATIISRCQRFAFKKVGFDVMMKRLKNLCEEEGVKVEKDVLERVVRKSDGCMRDAESLLGQILSLNLKKITAADAEIVLPISHIDAVLKFIDSLSQKNSAQALDQIQQLVSEGSNIEQFALDAIDALRSIMILQANSQYNSLDYADADFKQLRKLSQSLNPQLVIAMIESLISRRREIKLAPVPQLPLELFVVEFASGRGGVSPPAPQAGNPPHYVNTPATGEGGGTPPLQTGSATTPEKSLTQTIKDKISTLTHKHSIKTTLDDVKNKWNDIINLVSEQNHSLSFILKMCDIASLDDNSLRLSVPYSLHKDKLEEHKTKKMIEKALHDTFGEKIHIVCAVSSTSSAVSNADSELNELAADFGGEVVN